MYSTGWFLYPIRTFLFSKDWGIIPALALLAGFAQRRSQLLKALAITLACYWLWIGYGSSKPTVYEPFWRLTRFGYHISFVAAILCGAWLTARRQSWTGILLITGMNIVLVAASGSFGQRDDISHKFLAYVREHAQEQFLTDEYSLREALFYNELTPLPNVNLWDKYRDYVPEGKALHIFFNPLNNQWGTVPNRPGYKPPTGPPPLCYGPPVWSTPIKYRAIATLLPDAIRKRSPWFVRGPSGYVFPVNGATPCGPLPLGMGASSWASSQ
jgi:hypothetical protein